MIKKTKTNQVVSLLLSTEIEMNNKIHNEIEELLRLGYENERSKISLEDLEKSLCYSIEEMRRVLKTIK